MIAIGINPVSEALRSAYNMRELFVEADSTNKRVLEIARIAKQKGIKVTPKSAAELLKLSGSTPTQHVIAEVDIEIKPMPSSPAPGMYVFIRSSQDLQNIGAIIRTAEVAGLAGVIVPPKLELHPTILRVSMGAAFHIPIYHASLFPAIKSFKSNSFEVYAIERAPDSNLFEQKLSANCLLIIGGENEPISEPIIARCDKILSIPQFGKVNSLNMSVAAAIVIYELKRQNTA